MNGAPTLGRDESRPYMTAAKTRTQMPPTLATSWMLLVVCVGTGAVLAAYLACGDAVRPRPEGEPTEEHAQGLQVGHGRVPRLLVALYIAMALGMIGYVLYIWLAAPGI